ncbi:hypothetical protein TYRP_019977 [Tyrophagus putrescentiae]|nr:hypothetical protein TYRP_019977 [Tyrophagus putrescentiae]
MEPPAKADEAFDSKGTLIMENRLLKESLTICLEFKRILDHMFRDMTEKESKAFEKYKPHYWKLSQKYRVLRKAFGDHLVAWIDNIDSSELTNCFSSGCKLPSCNKKDDDNTDTKGVSGVGSKVMDTTVEIDSPMEDKKGTTKRPLFKESKETVVDVQLAETNKPSNCNLTRTTSSAPKIVYVKKVTPVNDSVPAPLHENKVACSSQLPPKKEHSLEKKKPKLSDK